MLPDPISKTLRDLSRNVTWDGPVPNGRRPIVNISTTLMGAADLIEQKNRYIMELESDMRELEDHIDRLEEANNAT